MVDEANEQCLSTLIAVDNSDELPRKEEEGILGVKERYFSRFWEVVKIGKILKKGCA